MSASVLRVALTGGIATGKSYCLSRFAQLGVPVVDADQIARDVVKAGSPAFEAIIKRFGPAVRRTDGELDRHALATVVFSDAAARSDLEAIVHPAVYAAIDAWFESLSPRRPRGQRPTLVAIADIPLLYETGREVDFDRVVVAACSAAQQMERLVQRGHALAEATARLSAQLPIGEKVRRANYVIDTSGTMEETDRQVDRVHAELASATLSDP